MRLIRKDLNACNANYDYGLWKKMNVFRLKKVFEGLKI